MNNDSIIDEIRNYRENHARKFGFDLDRIVEDTKHTEDKLRSEGWDVITIKAAMRRPADASSPRKE